MMEFKCTTKNCDNRSFTVTDEDFTYMEHFVHCQFCDNLCIETSGFYIKDNSNEHQEVYDLLCDGNADEGYFLARLTVINELHYITVSKPNAPESENTYDTYLVNGNLMYSLNHLWNIRNLYGFQYVA